jgi:hypothetical protein
VPRRLRIGIADTRARHPPASCLLRRTRIAHIKNLITLVVELIVGDEVGRTRRHVHVFAVAKPELVHAARFLARAVNERDRLRLLGRRYVEQLEARRLLPRLLHLIGNRHDVADYLERIGAHVGLRQLGLHHHLRIARVGYVDSGEILRRAFVRKPDDAAAILGDLDRHALAHPAKAFQLVMRDELEIPFDLVARHFCPSNVMPREGGASSNRYRVRERCSLPRPFGVYWVARLRGRWTACYAPARAFSMKSGRSAFDQSGTADIFFSFSRISACSCM